MYFQSKKRFCREITDAQREVSCIRRSGRILIRA